MVRRRRPARPGRVPAVPRQRRQSGTYDVQRPPDLLRRLGRRLVGPGVVRHAVADDRGGVVARRRRQLDALDRRARRSARSRSSSASLALALRPRRPRARVRRLAAHRRRLAAALAAPASAWAHAALLRTVPEASRTVNSAAAAGRLTYSEAVEPRFAIVSVTDKDGRAARRPGRRGATRPIRTRCSCRCGACREGWYLVYWRVISVDGHPVRGAFTFAVGPNPGPAPQFQIPSISETAATPRARRGALGRLPVGDGGGRALRAADRDRAAARPPRAGHAAAGARRSRSSSRPRSALVAVPVYVVVATADFALRSAFDLGAIVPLLSVSAFGRGYLDARALLRALRRGRARRALGRPARAAAPLGLGAARRRAARGSARPRCCSSPASRATPRRPRRAGSSLALRLAAHGRRLDLGRRPDRAARPLARACRPRAASPGSPSACRASPNDRVRLGARADRLGDRRLARSTCRRSRRCGRLLRAGTARQDRAARGRAAARRGQPAAHAAAPAGLRAAARARARDGAAAAPARRRARSRSSPAPCSRRRC